MARITLSIGMLEVVKCSNKSSGQALSLGDNLLKKVSRWMTTEELQEGQLLLRMVLSTLDNGLTASEMDLDHKCGQTGPNTKVNGKMIRPTAKANWFMLTAMFMKGSG